MGRLTDNDRKFGPLTFGPTGSTWRPISLTIASRDDEYEKRCHLTGSAFGWTFRLWLPEIVKPYAIRHVASSWDAATVARMGRNWYEEIHPREFGFRLSDGFLQIFLGPQTMDSLSTKNWCTHLPWTQWRSYREGFFGTEGELLRWFYLDKRPFLDRFDEERVFKAIMPKRVFAFDDFDGSRITATTLIREHQMKFGTGWFKWLSLFRRVKIRRSLDIEFSAEVGRGKGSWKGGTLGHGIDMLPGELHEQAFRRYCAGHDLKFIGQGEAL